MDPRVSKGFLWILGFQGDSRRFMDFWGIFVDSRVSRGFLCILGFLGDSCEFSGF